MSASHPITATPPVQQVNPWENLPRRRLIITVIGLQLGIFLAALDQTIVATAMPRIVASLNGFEHYAWVTTAYLLTSTTAVPIAGKLSDMYGRKPFVLGSAAFFIFASVFCGLAQDMVQLSFLRGLQGIGGGVLMSSVLTVASALFPPAQRGRVQGIFSSVFGLASVAGPVLGGFITDNLGWRAIFYINLPVGLPALLVLWRSFPDFRPPRRDHAIDYWGAATLVLAVVPFLLALTWGGTQYPWLSAPIVGLITLSVFALAAFLAVERRHPEPIIPLGRLRRRAVALPIAGIGLGAVGMFAVTLFVPLFIQAVIGTSATESGTVLVPMTLAMTISSILNGQLVSHIGRYKPSILAGSAVATAGLLMLSGMGPGTDHATVVRNIVIFGIGLSATMPSFTIAAQNAVSVDDLGVVTSMLQFFRSIGATLGAAALGGLLVGRFTPELLTALAHSEAAGLPLSLLRRLENPQALLDPAIGQELQQSFQSLGPGSDQLFAAAMAAVRQALAASLHEVFLLGALAVALACLGSTFLPEMPLRRASRPRPDTIE